ARDARRAARRRDPQLLDLPRRDDGVRLLRGRRPRACVGVPRRAGGQCALAGRDGRAARGARARRRPAAAAGDLPPRLTGLLGPEVRGRHAVAALGPIGADRDHLEAVGARLERADDLRREADDVPPAQLDDLVVELDPAGAVDDDVHLLLLAVVVPHRRADAGPVAEVADAEMLRIDVLAGEPRLHTWRVVAGRVVDVLEVLDREARHEN